MEKKLVSFGMRLDEHLMAQIKALAEDEGMTESAFVRMAISNLIEMKRNQYLRLHSIFGYSDEEVNKKHVEHCSTCESAESAGRE